MKNEDKILPIGKSIKIALIGPSSDVKGNFFGGYSSVSTASTTSRDFDRSEDDNYIKMAYQAMITEYKDGQMVLRHMELNMRINLHRNRRDVKFSEHFLW